MLAQKKEESVTFAHSAHYLTKPLKRETEITQSRLSAHFMNAVKL